MCVHRLRTMRAKYTNFLILGPKMMIFEAHNFFFEVTSVFQKCCIYFFVIVYMLVKTSEHIFHE